MHTDDGMVEGGAAITEALDTYFSSVYNTCNLTEDELFTRALRTSVMDNAGSRLLLTRRDAGTLFVQLDRQSADRSVTYRVMRSSRLAGGAVSLVLAIEEYV
ncbi:hypothetical protein J6590_087647 [Homalodisca vitripennis]|nr:hypothetical protein J6590_087647 [Homalodisca vitripennis]